MKTTPNPRATKKSKGELEGGLPACPVGVAEGEEVVVGAEVCVPDMMRVYQCCRRTQTPRPTNNFSKNGKRLAGALHSEGSEV